MQRHDRPSFGLNYKFQSILFHLEALQVQYLSTKPWQHIKFASLGMLHISDIRKASLGVIQKPMEQKLRSNYNIQFHLPGQVQVRVIWSTPLLFLLFCSFAFLGISLTFGSIFLQATHIESWSL